MAPADAPDGGVVLLLRAAADSLRVVSAGDAGSALDLSLQKARDALACTNAVFCAVDGSGNLTVRASADPEGLQVGDSMDLVTTLSGKVLRSGEATRATADRVRNVNASSSGSRGPAMAVPVVSGGTIAGVLSVCRCRGEPEYTDDELSALSTFGDFMGALTDVERERAERESRVEIAVRERLGQAVLTSVISELLRATTGMHGVLAAVDGQQREELIRYVRAVDRALVGFRGILAGEFAEPAPEPGDVGEARSGRPKVESTVRFPGSFAPGGDWGWEDGELLDEMTTTSLRSSGTSTKSPPSWP